jgi:hypothetical protein
VPASQVTDRRSLSKVSQVPASQVTDRISCPK